MRFLIGIIFFLLTLNTIGQTDSSLHKKADTTYFYRTLVPLDNQMPTAVYYKVDSSKLFIIKLVNKSIIGWYNSKPIKFTSFNKLNDFIIKNITEILGKECRLETDDNQPYDRVKKVLDIFTKNNIERYSITDIKNGHEIN